MRGETKTLLRVMWSTWRFRRICDFMDEGNAFTRVPPQFAAPSASSQPSHHRRCPRALSLRRSLPSQRIATGETRHAHAECTKRPNSSQPRRRSRTHSAALHAHGFAAESRPRIPAVFRRPSNGNTKSPESSIRRSRTLPPLYGGSQHRSGRTHINIARIARQVRTTHAPLAAKGRPVRTAKMALRCRPRTPPFPQLGGEAAPIQIIA